LLFQIKIGASFPEWFKSSGVAMLESLKTDRLLLRRWRESDRLPFQAMNADPRVMEFMPSLLAPAESDALITRIESHFARHGLGLFAAERLDDATFAGFIGLSVPAFDAHFMPAVEIGWRLAFDFWGQGLATEGARAVAHYAFDEVGLDSIVSFTVPANMRSRRVMERIGMTHDPRDDFDHPGLPKGHPLRHHVLFRLSR
jgi:RimJ/RimL family protein N-acetyltransferase